MLIWSNDPDYNVSVRLSEGIRAADPEQIRVIAAACCVDGSDLKRQRGSEQVKRSGDVVAGQPLILDPMVQVISKIPEFR